MQFAIFKAIHIDVVQRRKVHVYHGRV